MFVFLQFVLLLVFETSIPICTCTLGLPMIPLLLSAPSIIGFQRMSRMLMATHACRADMFETIKRTSIREINLCNPTSNVPAHLPLSTTSWTPLMSRCCFHQMGLHTKVADNIYETFLDTLCAQIYTNASEYSGFNQAQIVSAALRAFYKQLPPALGPKLWKGQGIQTGGRHGTSSLKTHMALLVLTVGRLDS